MWVRVMIDRVKMCGEWVRAGVRVRVWVRGKTCGEWAVA